MDGQSKPFTGIIIGDCLMNILGIGDIVVVGAYLFPVEIKQLVTMMVANHL